MNHKSKHHIIYIAVIIILLIVIAGESYYLHKKTKASRIEMNLMQQMHEKGSHGMGGMAMTPISPPSINDQQSQQLTTGTNSAIVQKKFNITAGNFYFVPNKITVNKGDQVTFFITNTGGVHDLVIDELGIKTPVTHTGNSSSVTFTATKTGSFTYYCSIPGHKVKGMWGTLVIQ